MNKTLGIIGGGQLGMFLCMACKKRNIKTIVLDPNPECSCKKYADELIVSDYDNKENIKKLFDKSDNVTFEFENISSDVLDDNTSIIPKENSLIISQNRILEKLTAKSCGFKIPKFSQINNFDALFTYKEFPYVLKSTTGGYDGKNQWVLNTTDDIKKINIDSTKLKDMEFILEEKIDFDFEFSVIGYRNQSNDFYFFPPFINEHKNGILHHSKIAKDLNFDTSIIKRFMEKMSLYGILCIEFFYKKGEFYFNELAPRPHNSGHLTLDAFKYNQFDMAVSSIFDSGFPKNDLIQYTEMYNVLGQDYEKMKGTEKFYDYYKSDAKVNRKMGHINIPEDISEKVRNKFNG